MILNPGASLKTAALTLADGRELRYVHAGEGSPVVVFEAGMGACASGWITVQRMASSSACTVSYDRAGYAGSTPDPHPRSLIRMSDDLDALIDHVSPGAPVVLVGHSFGGPMVRCYSALHPERVAGIVLVDATVSAILSPVLAKITPWTFRLVVQLHRLGIGPALMKRSARIRPSSDVPAADMEIFARDLFARRSVVASLAEAKELRASLPLRARWESDGLPMVPVKSLVASGTSPREAKMRARLTAANEQEMARHPQAECRLVADSGHFVPQEHPQATADAILEVVAAARGKASVGDIRNGEPLCPETRANDVSRLH